MPSNKHPVFCGVFKRAQYWPNSAAVEITRILEVFRSGMGSIRQIGKLLNSDSECPRVLGASLRLIFNLSLFTCCCCTV